MILFAVYVCENVASRMKLSPDHIRRLYNMHISEKVYPR